MMAIRRSLWGFVAAALFVLLCSPQSVLAATTGPTIVKWNTQAIVKLTLTPNYAVGFGSVPAVFGTQPAPTVGPDASFAGGAVDFGSVLTGKDYLYKYAVHLNVFTSDPAGFNLFGEGAADFYNSTDTTSQPIQQDVFYAPSTSGSPADSNTGFTSGLPFYKTSGSVSPAQPNFAIAPSITYVTYPSPIASSSTAIVDYYYDYELHVPALASTGAYFVWVVYTVVAK